MKYPRLDRMEERARALLDDQAFVVVTFADRSRRTMHLDVVIGLLREGRGPRVVDVRSDEYPDQGQLYQLIRGIVLEDVT